MHIVIPRDIAKKNKLKSANPEKVDDIFCSFEMINMLAINPIEGFRRDKNVTAFRSFLVELDDGKLSEQMKYVKNKNMPYSACVFSGGKSLHFVITLEEPLPSLNLYKQISKWILNVMDKADSQTSNPSRSVRFPGNLRRMDQND